MDLAAKLPEMEDSALAVLRENAGRLEQIGTSTQKAQAAALMPASSSSSMARATTGGSSAK